MADATGDLQMKYTFLLQNLGQKNNENKYVYFESMLADFEFTEVANHVSCIKLRENVFEIYFKNCKAL